MRKLAFIAVLFFVTINMYLGAQDVPPAMFVKEGEKSRALEVASIKIETRIYGNLAQTQMIITFFNPANRAVAGDLYFPLPEGATVSGYALDIEGKMIDGVVVEKHKGRQVFEEIVREGIDPGLVEWTKGNNFKTRVFPIPAQGTRTVKICYISELIQREESTNYYLPFNFKQRIADFSIRIQVIKPVAPPQVKQGGFSNFQFARWEDSYVAQTVLKNADLSQDLIISLPSVEKQPLLIEKAEDGVFYFLINDLPVIPNITDTKTAPKKICIYWDASSSCSARDQQRTRGLIARFFKNYAANSITVDVVVIRDKAEKPRSFVITRGDSKALISFLEEQPYDGGTQLGAIAPPAAGTDYAFLFTDGISNFGFTVPPELGVPLYIFSDQSGSNHAFLRYLALKNSGQYFNMIRLEDSVIISRIGRPVYEFIGAKISSGAIGESYPRYSQPAGARFTYVGILESATAKITLQYGINGNVEKEVTYTVTKTEAGSGELLRLSWAQKKLEELIIFPKRNKDLIVSLGQEYGFVTPGTSLIVLESLDQYVEHRIPPPKTLPDLRRQYFNRIAQAEKEKETQKQSKIDYVLALWETRVAWWNKRFIYPEDFKYKEDKDEEGITGRGGAEDFAEGEESEPSTAYSEVESESSGAYDETTIDEAKKEKEVAESVPAEIELKAWDPDTPYLNALKNAKSKDLYLVYLEQKKEYSDSPAFFLDCGDYFIKQKLPELGLRIWTNIAELELENPALLRILAHRLAQEEMLLYSKLLFEEVLKLRPEEPQSYRDLALVLGRMQEYEKAIELLYQVVLGEWDRFEEIEVIALMEMNNLITKAKQKGITKFAVDSRLIKNLAVDVRIILTWDADLTDMDLWVTEPSGEKAYYGNQLTTIGGHFSRDFTQGYGPEEYIIKRAMKGVYKIEVNYYGSSSPELAGTVTLQVDIFTNYGKSDQERKSITIRLRETEETLLIGEISF